MNNIIKSGIPLIIGTYSMIYTLNYIKVDCEKQLQKRLKLQYTGNDIITHEQKSKILK